MHQRYEIYNMSYGMHTTPYVSKVTNTGFVAYGDQGLNVLKTITHDINTDGIIVTIVKCDEPISYTDVTDMPKEAQSFIKFSY